MTGLRRDQGVTRADTPKLEIDSAHGGMLKVNPIADWTREQVEAYVAEHGVPTNRLHAAGYPSVGCAPCSRAKGSMLSRTRLAMSWLCRSRSCFGTRLTWMSASWAARRKK